MNYEYEASCNPASPEADGSAQIFNVEWGSSSSAPNKSLVQYRLSFLERIAETHRAMITENNALKIKYEWSNFYVLIVEQRPNNLHMTDQNEFCSVGE